MRKIARYTIGEIPLLQSIADRMDLRNILDEFIPQHHSEEVAPADILILLIYNLAIGKDPLYGLEKWICSIDLRCIGCEIYENVKFNDDRFGRILDRLFLADRASLMTAVVLSAIKTFKIDLKQLHNDSTTVKASGKYTGKTKSGFELKKGKSKDHRPDLKQLLFSLSISADGAVPIHYKSYPGNRTDDTTHIETWDRLCEISNRPDFLYVADCKVCTDKQLSYITGKHGRVVTIMPETWGEAGAFKNSLRDEKKSKTEILRKTDNNQKINYYYVYEGNYKTTKRGYLIHWIHSSAKAICDCSCREARLTKAENMLLGLLPKINKRKLKSQESISEACDKILSRYKVSNFITITIGQTSEEYKVQAKSGRPGKNAEYKSILKAIHTISWTRNKAVLDKEKNVDGVFPLLSTDLSISAREALVSYKYQPRLEKRFSQFKSIHNAAPLLFKKLERVEANMFVFFIALMFQALIEREIRHEMKHRKLPYLQIYPEGREALRPTTSKVFEVFSQISSYKIVDGESVIEEFTDEFNETQKLILELLDLEKERYWNLKTSLRKTS